MLSFSYFPTWLHAEIIPGLPIRWYGLMYVIAFSITFFLTNYQIKKDSRFNLTVDDLTTASLWAIVGLLIGARIIATTVYDPDHFYITHPWLIFWPFNNGNFTGLQGMSYHGGVLGTTLGIFLFAKKYKKNFFQLADLFTAAIPLGYTFGRLGNFINGELWGRVTAKPWGIIFPFAPSFSSNYSWVKDIAQTIGLPYQQGGQVNLPRHPSQLYEAFFEGIFLWVLLWFFFRKRKSFHGYIASLYLIGYGLVRFIIEYFREPDSDLGFIIAWGKEQDPAALFLSPFNISMGQILCIIMIISGIVLFKVLEKRSKLLNHNAKNR